MAMALSLSRNRIPSGALLLSHRHIGCTRTHSMWRWGDMVLLWAEVRLLDPSSI